MDFENSFDISNFYFREMVQNVSKLMNVPNDLTIVMKMLLARILLVPISVLVTKDSLDQVSTAVMKMSVGILISVPVRICAA